jgi:regulator of replication initiation timing
LWEKLKKWQQTAEKLKEKLKEKTDECQRLQNNYEKLRNLISCIEREKWYLRGKYRGESMAMANWMSPPDVPRNHEALVEDLQRECQELRDRVKELVDRLNHRDNEKTDDNTISPSTGYEVCLVSLYHMHRNCIRKCTLLSLSLSLSLLLSLSYCFNIKNITKDEKKRQSAKKNCISELSIYLLLSKQYLLALLLKLFL